MREAVLASERLADVLVRLSQQGLRPRGAIGEPMTAADIEAGVSTVRQAVGGLALTCAPVVSSHFDAYAASVRALIELAREVAWRGVGQRRRRRTSGTCSGRRSCRSFRRYLCRRPAARSRRPGHREPDRLRGTGGECLRPPACHLRQASAGLGLRDAWWACRGESPSLDLERRGESVAKLSDGLARPTGPDAVPRLSHLELEEARRRTRPREAWLEELFSALWRLDMGVLDLFSPEVRAAVG